MHVRITDSGLLALTCVSTGGPATRITWTRDSEIIIEGSTETVLNNPETARYTHTLNLTDGVRGLYGCTVSNNKPSKAVANTSII